MRIGIGALAIGLIVAPAFAQSGYVTEVSNSKATSAATAQAEDVLTNEQVVQLVKIGLGDEAIIAKIRTSQTKFDTSTDDLISLKSRGVSGPVIAAMLSPASGFAARVAEPELSADSADPKLPHYPGLYMLNAIPGSNKMARINPTVSNQAKTGGIIGYALTGGIASMSIKAAIPGESARVQTSNRQPVFYAYFDESVPRALQSNGNTVWANGIGTVTSSPAEITLSRFSEKKGRREARVGSLNIAGAKTGVMDKDQIQFDSEMISPGIFKVTVRTPLEPGEYGFIQSVTGNGSQGALTARVFDFGIQ